MSRVLFAMIVVVSAAGLFGCAGSSRVDESAATPTVLAIEKKAVAVMRIGAASPACKHVAVLLGTPEGTGFRRHRVLQVMNVHSLVEPPVAEAELTAGAYHVVGYSCHDGKAPGVVADKADAGTYRTSYASFRLRAGEVVNVGYLHFHAAKVGKNAFGRSLKIDVTVSDWPLVELDRFKQKRPLLFDRMVTRLMTPTDNQSDRATAQDCTRLVALRAQGKVQTLPDACRSPTPTSNVREAVGRKS